MPFIKQYQRAHAEAASQHITARKQANAYVNLEFARIAQASIARSDIRIKAETTPIFTTMRKA